MSKALAIFRDLRYRIKHFLTDTSDMIPVADTDNSRVGKVITLPPLRLMI